MNLKSKASLYFIIATGLPLIATVLILYFYLIGGLQRIENENIAAAFANMRAHFEKEGETLSQRISRAIRADDYRILQLLMTRDRQGQIDQSRLIEMTGQFRNLLHLDILQIIGPDNTLLASGSNPTDFGRKSEFEFLDSIKTNNPVMGFKSMKFGEYSFLVHIGAEALSYKDSLIAQVVGGIVIDDFYLREMDLPYNVEVVVLSRRGFLSSTMDIETTSKLEDQLAKRVKDYSSDFELNGIGYSPYYQSLYSLDPDEKYQVLLLYPPSYARLLTSQSFRIYGVVAIAGILIAGLLGYAFASRLSRPIKDMSIAAEQISQGEFDQKIFYFGSDELGKLIDSFNQMYDRLNRSQRKLIQAEKLAAWNQMARKVAHEIKNPLTPIKLSIEDLRRSYLRNPAGYADILDEASDTILNEIEKLKRIVNDFSAFAKLPSPELRPIDTLRLVNDSLKLYRGEIDAGRIIIRSDDSPATVMADPGLFSQAIVNLVKNAMEADPEGTIIVSVKNLNGQVIIAVKDHGIGISPENRSQIFTPYFTTKSGGSGLGLVITQRIVFDHGGEISVNSSETEGTVFEIRLDTVNHS